MAQEVSVSLPARDYALVGELLAEAVETSARTGQPVLEALEEVAGERGRRLQEEVGSADAPAQLVQRVLAVLAEHGFEPREGDGQILLANCPFHALAQQHTQLVCGMNHTMLGCLTDSLEPRCLSARLDPAPGRCCVVLEVAAD